MIVRVRRAYEPPEPEDGDRVLVDRLWPRGLTKAEARVDAWPKEITPSPELRRWFHSPEGEWEEFRRRYEAELAASRAAAEALGRLRERARAGTVTLLTASREPGRSHVAVLVEQLGSCGREAWPVRPSPDPPR